jgi:hypothetical protein
VYMPIYLFAIFVAWGGGQSLAGHDVLSLFWFARCLRWVGRKCALYLSWVEAVSAEEMRLLVLIMMVMTLK